MTGLNLTYSQNVELQKNHPKKNLTSKNTSKKAYSYYPFGMTHKGYNNVVNSNSNNVAELFSYNGKELEEDLGLGLFDYHARHYDVSIARWTTIDPLAEDMTRHSPYNYAFNNPIYFIDPDGMAPEGIIDEDFDRDIKSTFVNERGEIIEHRDDGDPNIYLVTDPKTWDGSTNGLSVIGRETPGRSYTPGSLIYTDDIFYGAQVPDRFITFPYIGPQVNEFYSPLFDILGVGGWRKALSLIRGLKFWQKTRITAKSVKEFKSLIKQLSRPGGDISRKELRELEKLAKKYGGRVRKDFNPVKKANGRLDPHVHIEGLGQRIKNRHIFIKK